MATIHLVSPIDDFGPWGPTSPDDPGIGGSETMHCEMAWRLAARGHHVISYAPLRENTPRWHRGVEWRHSHDADTTAPGLWILVRDASWLDRFVPQANQRVWCVFQDCDIRTAWPESWYPAVTRIIGLCTAHCVYLRARHPLFAEKIVQSRNGLRGDLVDKTLFLPLRSDRPFPARNPHRLMFASSPDRGLRGLLRLFSLIRFLVPDAELHVFYGWDNIDYLPSKGIQWQKQQLLKLAHQPGVLLRGRMGQPRLYQEWVQSGLMVAPTNFLETGHITLLEAQALGAIPIVNPVWATGEYLLAGYGIEGDAEQDDVTLRRYAMTAVHLMQHPEIQDAMRASMMSEARKRFDWEGVVDQYEEWFLEDIID